MQEVQEAADEGATLVDRRRPGRLTAVHPNLLPLLRAEERARLPGLPAEAAHHGGDRWLGAEGGLVVGVGLGSLLWVGIVAAGRALFGI